VNPIPEEIENFTFKYIFQNYADGIKVKAGYKFDWCMSMYGEDVDWCYYNNGGEDFDQV
jgi:hypothetical protein